MVMKGPKKVHPNERSTARSSRYSLKAVTEQASTWPWLCTGCREDTGPSDQGEAYCADATGMEEACQEIKAYEHHRNATLSLHLC